jgi:branched-chain amino acid transport system permease protein
VFFIFFQARGLTGGDDGLRGIPPPILQLPVLGGIELEGIRDPNAFYYFVLLVVVVCLVAIQRIVASPFGRVLQAIRESEERARAVGYETNRLLLLAFVFSGLFAGVAGSLYALFFGFIGLETLNWTTAGVVVMMTILGGVGTFVGPFVGAAIFLTLQEYVSKYTDAWQLYTGAIFVACVLFFPEGVWGMVLRLARRQPRVPGRAVTAAVGAAGGGESAGAVLVSESDS